MNDNENTRPIRGKFTSSNKITEVAYEIYEPRGEARAVVQLSHGMCEYVGRYADFAEYLNSKGIVFAGNDHIGHGNTAKNDGELGYFGGKRQDHDYLWQDLHIFTRLLKERYPEKPIILLGHSMGSFVARLYLSRYAEELAGAIIMGTAGSESPTGLAVFLSNIAVALCGARHRGSFLKKLSSANNLKRCEKGCSSAAWLTHDEKITTKYLADRFCNYTFTDSAYRELFLMLGEVSTPEWASTLPTDLPILLTSGEDDPVGNFGNGVRDVAARLRGAGMKELTVKLYDGMRHEILNETGHEKVYSDIGEWIESVLASPVSSEAANRQ